MKTFSYFDEQSKKVIQEGMFRLRRQPYGNQPEEDRYNEKSPETIIVKIPPIGGIPAATVEVIEGPYTLKYTMGKAQCEVMFLERSFEGFNSDSDMDDFLDDDVLASPIEYTAGVSQIPHLEYIYNPYLWPVFGYAKDIGDNPLNPPTKLLTTATRERGGLWVVARPPDFYRGNTLATIPEGGSGLVGLLIGGEPVEIVEAFNDWGSTGDIADDTEVFVKFFEDDRKWVIVKPGGGGTTTSDTGIKFTNDAGEDIPPHAVMGTSGETTIGLFEHIKAIRPGSNFHVTWFVNRNQTVASNDEDKCDMGIDKPIPVLIDSSMSAFISVGTQLGPKSGSFAVWPGYLGFTAVGDPRALDGVEVVDCIQHPVTRVFGRLQNDITQNADGTSSGFFQIWVRNPFNNRRENAGWPNSLVVRAPLLNLGQKALTGTFGWAEAYSNLWEGDFACDPDDTNTSQSSFAANLPSQQFANDQSQFTTQQPPSSGSTGTGTGTI